VKKMHVKIFWLTALGTPQDHSWESRAATKPGAHLEKEIKENNKDISTGI
jgi:hypothetical protein